MKSNKQTFLNLGGIAVAITLLAVQTSFGQGGEPSGPTKPVLVVNTAAQPVPVIGTVTGVVTLGGTSNVNVVNMPTVKIDPANNSVVVSPRLTQLIVNTGIYVVSDGGYPTLGPFEVAQFSKIRVVAHNQSDSAGSFGIFVSARLPGGLILSLDPTITTLQPGGSFARVYEVPGQFIQINVQGNGPDRNGIIAVFGN